MRLGSAQHRLVYFCFRFVSLFVFSFRKLLVFNEDEENQKDMKRKVVKTNQLQHNPTSTAVDFDIMGSATKSRVTKMMFITTTTTTTTTATSIKMVD